MIYGYINNLLCIAGAGAFTALALAIWQHQEIKAIRRRQLRRERRAAIEAAAIANRFRILDICNEFADEVREKQKKQTITYKGIFADEMNKELEE